MTTQELKSYIDRILGNNVRCLLSSYWWKRILGKMADSIESVEKLSLYASKTAYALSSTLYDKQDKLYSGSNIKTINGQSILGSGNLEIGGCEDLEERVDSLENKIKNIGGVPYEHIKMRNGEVTTLKANIYYTDVYVHESGDVYTIELEYSGSGNKDIFTLEFATSTEPITVNLPSNVKWANGVNILNEIEINTIYVISIVSGIAVGIKTPR